MVCAAIGLCQSEQAALAKLQASEQLKSNDIPQVDLAQPVAPFILNVPQLLYPQESPKQEAPQKETPMTVHVSSKLGGSLILSVRRLLLDLVSSPLCRKLTTCARTASSF